MNKKQSISRRMRRQAMRNAGQTFTDRVRESVRTGRPVAQVHFQAKEGTKS